MARSRYVGLLVLLIGLAGCGSADPAAPPRPSVTATPSGAGSTPSPLADTKAGAVAFASRYIDLINAAQTSGNTSQLRGVSSGGCGGCNGVAESIEGIQARGDEIRGGRWKIIASRATRIDSQRSWLVVVRCAFSAQQVTHENKIVGTSPSGEQTLNISASLDGSWTVTRMAKA